MTGERDDGWSARVPLVLIVAGLSVATVGYGGFARPYAVALAVAIQLAIVAALVSRAQLRLTRLPDELGCAVLALLALGGWALVRGTAAGDTWSGLPMAMLCLGGAVVLVMVGAASDTARRWLVLALLTLGAGVALVAWFGTLTHTYPLAVADQGVWRASSTLGYPNALAGLLGPLALVAAGRLLDRGGRDPAPGWGTALLLTLLLVGWASAFSRGGAVAMAAGLALALILVPRGAVVRTLWAPVLGALVVLGGLAPGLRGESDVAVVPGVIALAVGLVTAVAPWLPRPRWRYGSGQGGSGRGGSGRGGSGRGAAGAAVAAVSVVGTAALAWAVVRYGRTATDAIQALVSGKVSVNSSYRLDQHGAAFDVVAAHPVTGVGPGNADLRWTEPDGSVLVARYVHDEYVQVIVETGLIGGVALGVAVVALAVTLLRGHRAAATPATAGTAAGALAFAVHSGFDFLWHLPVLPLVVLCLVAAVSRRRVPAQQGTGTRTADVSGAAPAPDSAAASPRPTG